MENLEKKIKKSIKKAKIKNAVIGLIAGVGVVGIGAVVPGVFKILKFLNLDQKVFNSKRQVIYNAIQRLKKEELLAEAYQKGKKCLVMTAKGHQYFTALQHVSKHKKQKWDMKWRIVIFDIEEKYRSIREKVRRELISYGFLKLQNSVWIYPYPCEEYVSLLKADNRTGKHLLYLIVDEVEGDKAIKEYFNIR